VSHFYSFYVVSRSGCSPSWILASSAHAARRFFFRIIFGLVSASPSIPSSGPGSGLVPYRSVDLFTLTPFFGCSCSGPVSSIHCRGEGVLPGFIFAACAHQSRLREILPRIMSASVFIHVGARSFLCLGFSSWVCFLQSVLAGFLFLPVSTTFTRDFHFDSAGVRLLDSPRSQPSFLRVNVCSVFPFEAR
jgi:hypothetical protein